MTKPFLFIGIRAQDAAADDEYAAVLRCARLDERDVRRVRIEQEELGPVDLDDWSGIVVGGGPWNVSDPQHEKDADQIRGEARLRELALQVLDADFPFLGACYGIGTLGTLRNGVVDRAVRRADRPDGHRPDRRRAGEDQLLGGLPAHVHRAARAQGGRVPAPGRRGPAGVVRDLPGPGLPDRRQRLRHAVPPGARPAGDHHPHRGLRSTTATSSRTWATRSSTARAPRSSPSRPRSSSGSSTLFAR